MAIKSVRPHSENYITNLEEDKADVFLKGGTVLNVYSGELLKANVALKEERIWYVGPLSQLVGNDTLVLDVGDKLLVPAYIEPHFHPWDIYNPVTFGEEACRLGTTTIFCDNLIFYVLMGPALFEEFMAALRDMPIKFFWSCRAAPQTPMKGEQELFSFRNVERLLSNPSVQSLGELTRWKELVKGNSKLLEMIHTAKRLRKRVDGHTAGAKYAQLNVISRVGVESCHESISGEEALERLRLGLYVILRESSLRQDLSGILRAVKEGQVLTDRLMLTTDSSSPSFYEEFGITDNLIKIAIREGIDPVLAYRMSTLNPAVYFGLDSDIGGIAPGRYGDILVLKDLLHPTPEMVISKGCIVSKNSVLEKPFPRIDWGKFFPKTSFSKTNWRARSAIFEIPCEGTRIKFPAIKLISPVITRTEWVECKIRGGALNLSEKEGLCYLACLSKDGRWVTNGILQGFGGGIEGLASSFNTATEILVIGRSPAAMSRAVNRVREINGGIVAVENGEVAYELALPLGGIMSNAPMRRLAEKDREFKEFVSRRGYPFHDPLYTLMFLPNDFLPDVRINYGGVIDIRNNEILWPRRELERC